MRVLKLTMVAVSVAIALLSCEAPYIDKTNEVITITAENEQIASATKTVIDDKSLKITWLANDAINVFFGASESSRFVTETSGKKAQFKGSVSVITGGGEDLTEETTLWGVYPYKSTTTCDGTSITYTLPSEQSAKEGSFADDLFPQIARSQNFFMSFYNLCGSFRFVLSRNDIVKVTLAGNNNEPLAGKVRVSMPLGGVPTVSEVLDGETLLTMSAPDGECFEEGTNYYFVLYPTTFSKGLTLTFYTKNDTKASFKTTSSYTLPRNLFVLFDKLDKNLTYETYDDESDKTENIAVGSVSIDEYSSMTLPPNFSHQLTATILPHNATDKTIEWSSSDESVVTVDQEGNLYTTSKGGYATITAEAGERTGSCYISVILPITTTPKDYVDEYNVNHGPGIVIGDAIWAPVNCGYKAPTTDSQGIVTDKGYPYGKLYQWGRKYGQGYSDEYDKAPEIVEGPVSLEEGQNPDNANKFYTASAEPYDWTTTPNDNLWNFGTEDEPKKSSYDPCPDGWRVPTYKELDALAENYSEWITEQGQRGRWLSDFYTYLEKVPQVFFTATGSRGSDGNFKNRGEDGLYWSSRYNDSTAYSLFSLNFHPHIVTLSYYSRVLGKSVRCVQDNSL